jgi:hypothetical protein
MSAATQVFKDSGGVVFIFSRFLVILRRRFSLLLLGSGVFALVGSASLLGATKGYAVDFAIDMPQELDDGDGLVPPEDANFAGLETLEADSAEDVGIFIEDDLLSTVPPMPRGFKPSIYETDKFPVPVCLVSNVRFWKQVYREIDTNEAIIHDREDLSRVFARIKLSAAGTSRRSAEISEKRGYFGARLQQLAGKISQGSTDQERGRLLDAVDRDLLAVFRPADRTPQKIFEASSRLRVQTGLKSRFDGGVRRSIDLMPTITRILDGAGVPRDIVHLPHVESSYVRNARSKVGAVGLWQIMPDTMRMLKGRHAISKRTDPVLSTRAAAKLLAQNYRSLKSWPLALTAYNHGPGGVRRAVRTTGSRDLCTIIERYESRSFRFASSNFYAQFLAARHVALDKYSELAVSSSHGRVLRPLLAHALREKSSEE